MKKFLSVILIAMLVLTGAFAATTTAPVNKGGWDSANSSDVTVQLVVDPVSMFAYAFGFTNQSAEFEANLGTNDFSESGLPAGATSPFSLTFDPVTFKATNGEGKLSFYYKIRNNEKVALQLSISDGLTPTSGDLDTQPKVEWTVTVSPLAQSSETSFGSSVILKSETSGKKLTHKMVVDQPSDTAPHLKYLACGLVIETGTISSLLKEATTFEGTITLGVTTVV